MPRNRKNDMEEFDKPETTEDEVEHQHAEPSAVDKVIADVKPRTDAHVSVAALVEGLALEFQALAGTDAGQIEGLAESFIAKSKDLAEAALEGVEGNFAGAEKQCGYDPAPKVELSEQAKAYGSGHDNTHAVRSAVAHGMDEKTAHAMTTHGSNT